MNGNAAQKLGGEPLNPYAAPAGDPSPVAANDRGGELATPSSRLGARIVDQFLLLGALLPAAIPGALLSANAESGGNSNAVALVLAMAVGGLGALGFYFYQCHLIASTGQSLGKRWCDVRIVLEEGGPPGLLHGVVLRSWLLAAVSLIPLIGSVIGLADSLMIFSQGHRCLHDRLAGTRVLKG